MKPEEQALLNHLLSDQRVLALAVVVEGEPVIGMLPFVVQADFSAAIVHASRLARHTAGLLPDALCSLLIHEPDSPAADPLQMPRIMLTARVQTLGKKGDSYVQARDRYLAKFPESAPIFDLSDFNLFALHFVNGRLVGGFARAINITPEALRALSNR